MWPSVAAGITDEANALNCLSLSLADQKGPTTSSPSSPSFARLCQDFAKIAEQLTHVQEHQNIVRTALCAPVLLSTLTFKSKMVFPPTHPPGPPFSSSSPLGELIKP